MRNLRSCARAAAALTVGAVLLSGCDFDVYKLPLPGGADTGDQRDQKNDDSSGTHSD